MTTRMDEQMSPMVEMDAREFGLHLKEGGWRLGLLVARSVEPGEGESSGIVRSERAGLNEGVKVSAARFAEMAGTHHSRVMRYYRAWERYAHKGNVPHATDLDPGDEPELDWTRLPRWSLSELPPEPSATGPLKLAIKLGAYGERLKSAHKRLLTFVEKELPEVKTPGKDVRQMAGRYAACLEAEARLLRSIEHGQAQPSIDELELSNFFETS